jgi:hypothetical protein
MRLRQIAIDSELHEIKATEGARRAEEQKAREKADALRAAKFSR